MKEKIVKIDLEKMGVAAKKAAQELARASTVQKNRALKEIGKLLKKNQKTILEANQNDINLGKKNGLNDSLIDRLSLQGRLDGIISDIDQVIRLPDPIGELFDQQKLASNQLDVAKSRTPIGVLGVIYESRPNVTIDVTALALKSGNGAILRGGSETIYTNRVLVKVIREALEVVGLPVDAIQFIDSPDRELVKQLLHLHHYVDLIIPRGGAKLHAFCRENSKIPVITGGIGICHLFVDASADLKRCLEVILNAKTQRPTVCNALDTLLVHEKVAERFIPMVIAYLEKKEVEFRLDEKAWTIVNKRLKKGKKGCQRADDKNDWDIEWLSLVLGIKVVKNVDEAMEHIVAHSTGHSDGILTEDKKNAALFVRTIDSAAVYVNASTRFTDGSQLGLGAEVAISTQKLHARGPMGLRELTSYKWIISGDYAFRK